MTSNKPLNRIVEQHLCMGCGTCAAARPDLVTMRDTESGGRRPDIATGTPEHTLRALATLCPGQRIPALQLDDATSDSYEHVAWGPILEVWEGFAAEANVRRRAASGGVVTALSSFCLTDLAFTGAIHTRARPDEPLLNESFIATDPTSIKAASASRYAPASPCERLADLKERQGLHVFVGKPCDVAGASSLAQADASIGERIGLTMSIFCAGTPTAEGTRELARHLGLNAQDEVSNIRYRGNGWPGRMTMHYREADTGKQRSASTTYADGWGNVLQKHKQWRCQVCADHLGDHADLSVGDPWYRPIGQGEPGRSLVIVRTERGRRILEQARAAGVVHLARRSVETVAASQPNLEQTKGAVFGRCLTTRACGVGTPDYPGAGLHRVWWRALPKKAKLQSVAGTLKRVLRRRLFLPERTVALAESTRR